MRCTKTSNERLNNAFFAGQHLWNNCRSTKLHLQTDVLAVFEVVLAQDLYNLEKKNGLNLKLRLPFVLLGEALTGYIILVHQTRNALDCSHKCLSNPKCASFNFEIQQSRSPSTCELNNLSRMSSNNKFQSRDGFAYYEPLTPRGRSKQEITAIIPTRSKIITATVTTQEVSRTQAEAAIIRAAFQRLHSQQQQQHLVSGLPN